MYWALPSAWRVASLILLYIQQEFAVDRTHTLGDRIYKVIREQRGSTQTSYGRRDIRRTRSCVLEETFPEVETTVTYLAMDCICTIRRAQGSISPCANR